MTWEKNSPAPTAVKASQFPRVGLRSNREQSPRSSPTPAEAETNANSPLRQIPIGNETQNARKARLEATATSHAPSPAAHAPPATHATSRIEHARSPTL